MDAVTKFGVVARSNPGETATHVERHSGEGATGDIYRSQMIPLPKMLQQWLDGCATSLTAGPTLSRAVGMRAA
jgi:hypothetical protein